MIDGYITLFRFFFGRQLLYNKLQQRKTYYRVRC